MKNIILLTVISLLILASCNRMAPIQVTVQKSGLVVDSAMVVSAHPLASEIGAKILKQGGNAVDAAIAVQFALAVVYPVAGNIGGGGFMVIRENNGQIASLDFREKAPSAANRDMYLDENQDVIENLSLRGHLAAGVPGSVAGMAAAYEKYGSLPWNKLLEPAIDLANKGFKLTDREAGSLNGSQEVFKKYNTIVPEYVMNEKGWKEGDIIRYEELAKTLSLIKEHGKDGFYKGITAENIVAEMNRSNGIISLKDLENYEATWRTPLTGQYKGYKIITMPPPSSGGVALLQLLKSIEPHAIGELGYATASSIHLMTEAERRVYADRATHLGDPDFWDVPVDQLIGSTYNAMRMANYNADSATLSTDISAGETALVESTETTHFSIVDKYGNAVAVTTTLNGGFGSKVFVGGSGFLLNNEMDDFSIKPGVPNYYGLIGGEANAIVPGKRMLSSMTPTIVEKNGRLLMLVGTPGGSTIITSVFQTIINVIEYGMNIQQAVDAKRVHHQWKPDTLFIETDAVDSLAIIALKSMGHQISDRGKIGRVDAILMRKDNKLEGGADSRGDDTAAGSKTMPPATTPYHMLRINFLFL